jgi:anti-sigma regulatory factor (Ser/Thr protein kinase)
MARTLLEKHEKLAATSAYNRSQQRYGAPIMGDSLTLEIRNSHAALAPAAEAAGAWLQSHRASTDAMYFTLLAIEELVTNCIDYGYDDASEHTIVILLSAAQEMLTMVVIDDGHPFDPLARPNPDLSMPLQDRPIGGLGIYLLRELADHIAYERRDGQNRLKLTKQLR